MEKDGANRQKKKEVFSCRALKTYKGGKGIAPFILDGGEGLMP